MNSCANFAVDAQTEEDVAKEEAPAGFGATANKLAAKSSRAGTRRIMEIVTGMHYRDGGPLGAERSNF